MVSGLAERRILYLEVLSMNKQKLRRLTMAALCGAVAFVLMYFSFSVPVLSPFAEFDLSALERVHLGTDGGGLVQARRRLLHFRAAGSHRDHRGQDRSQAGL